MSALDMTEAKAKLADLRSHMPKASNPLVYEFGAFLANYLNDRLVPEGFVMGCELALNDLQTGVNGFTSKPIKSNLVGYPPQIFGLLRMEIPKIAEAVLPEEFAKGVGNFINQVNDAIAQSKA